MRCVGTSARGIRCHHEVRVGETCAAHAPDGLPVAGGTGDRPVELEDLENLGMRVNANLIVPIRFDHENQAIVTVAVGLPLAYARALRFDARRSPDTQFGSTWEYQPGLAAFLSRPGSAMLPEGARARHREDQWAARHADRVGAIGDELTRICRDHPGLVLDAHLRATARTLGTARLAGESSQDAQVPSYPISDRPDAARPVIGADMVIARIDPAPVLAPVTAPAPVTVAHSATGSDPDPAGASTVARRALAVLGADEVYRRLLTAQHVDPPEPDRLAHHRRASDAATTSTSGRGDR